MEAVEKREGNWAQSALKNAMAPTERPPREQREHVPQPHLAQGPPSDPNDFGFSRRRSNDRRNDGSVMPPPVPRTPSPRGPPAPKALLRNRNAEMNDPDFSRAIPELKNAIPEPQYQYQQYGQQQQYYGQQDFAPRGYPQQQQP